MTPTAEPEPAPDVAEHLSDGPDEDAMPGDDNQPLPTPAANDKDAIWVGEQLAHLAQMVSENRIQREIEGWARSTIIQTRVNRYTHERPELAKQIKDAVDKAWGEARKT